MGSHKIQFTKKFTARVNTLIALFCVISLVWSLWDAHTRTVEPIQEQEDPIVTLTGGWEYRWGDSPANPNANEVPLWALGHDPAGWKPTSIPGVPPGRQPGQNFLWLRIKPPVGHWESPALFVSAVDNFAHIYHEGRVVYKYGEPFKENPPAFAGWPWHMVRLTRSHDYIYFRFYSDMAHIGLMGPVKMGTHFDILKSFIVGRWTCTLISSFIIFIGVFLLGFYFVYRDKIEFLTLGLLCISSALNALLRSGLQIGLFYSPMFWLRLEYFALYVGGITYMTFIRQVITNDKLHRVVSFYFVGIFLLSLLVTWFGAEPSCLHKLFQFSALVMIPASILVQVKEAAKGNVDAKFVLVGLTCSLLLNGWDILLAFFKLNESQRFPQLSHWGILMLVGTFGAVLVRQFAEVHSNLKSKEAALATQMRRINALNSFSLQANNARTMPLIFQYGTDLLLRLFVLDAVLVAFAEPGSNRVLLRFLRTSSGNGENQMHFITETRPLQTRALPLENVHFMSSKSPLDRPALAEVFELVDSLAADTSLPQALRDSSLASAASMPLLTKDGVLIGLVVMVRLGNKVPTEDDVTLSRESLPFLSVVRTHIESALHNIILFEERSAKAKREGELIAARIEEERKTMVNLVAIAAEISDALNSPLLVVMNVFERIKRDFAALRARQDKPELEDALNIWDKCLPQLASSLNSILKTRAILSDIRDQGADIEATKTFEKSFAKNSKES